MIRMGPAGAIVPTVTIDGSSRPADNDHGGRVGDGVFLARRPGIGRELDFVMTGTSARTNLPRIDDANWYRVAGEVVKSMGSKHFHRELIKLLEASIESEAVWIIRYSGRLPPDVVYTHNVPDAVRTIYDARCSSIDPFSKRWNERRRGGVYVLSQLRDESADYLLYAKRFLTAARMDDELGVFLPETAHNCFAFFLERRSGHFSRMEIERARLLYPALASFHRAHLGWIFSELAYGDTPEAFGLPDRPTLIRDRTGQTVYASASWQGLERMTPPLLEKVDLASRTGLSEVEIGALVLRLEELGDDFPLAPGGRMFVVEPRPSSHVQPSIAGELDGFSRREREVLEFTLRGASTLKIAETLGLSAGTVKNAKLRPYRKAGVSTERELVQKYLALVG